MLMTLVVSAALCAAPKPVPSKVEGADPRLVGTWLAGSEPFITFAANGTGSMEEGKVKWSTNGANITITDDTGDVERATFQVEGDSMTMTIGGIPVPLRRAGAGGLVKKQSALSAKAAKANQNELSDEEAEKEAMALAQAWLAQNGQGGQGQGGPQQPRGQQGGRRGGAGQDQLSQLLLSSAWCSFSYSQISGSSSQTRVQYFANGTWSAGGQSETYNSGANGTVAGQYGSNNGGLWEVRNGQLWGSYGNAPLQLVQPFSVTRNSNGYPIINSLGKEYSSCQ